ncbi:MAG: NTP transferase domain-containing protein [Paludibacteraceae bacterium]|nr:NTP transferase domain-containing protein [Prevotellaceae bacterium]
MKYGIIAAGEGSRLASEGIVTPKPLIQLNGETLIDRLIRIFMMNDAESIAIIVNEERREVREHLSKTRLHIPLHLIVKSTPSSLHSFHALTPYLHGSKFCVTTVDTIFREDDFSGYIEEMGRRNHGMMGVTTFIDDESPLYVRTNENNQILSFEDNYENDIRFISGGIYGLTPEVFPTIQRCVESGIHRMRNFQREIIKSQIHLDAYPFSKIVDIDHACDIITAQKFISE